MCYPRIVRTDTQEEPAMATAMKQNLIEAFLRSALQ